MYTRELRVMPSDVSCTGTIKLRSLLNYFQDTAGLAAEDFEGTTTELIARGYAWVLMRYEIDFPGRLPALDEAFRITTFHDPKHGYNTLRCFKVDALDGRHIADAKTSWLLLDIKAGRPVKPIAHIPGITSRDNEDISPDFREIPEPQGEIARSVEFPVMFHDLDYNAHVNNAAYFEWVCDSSPVDLMTHELGSVYASFRSGARLGEKVTLNFSQSGDNTTTCRVTREGVKKPAADFLCVWRIKEEG